MVKDEYRWNQVQLAEAAGVSKSSVSLWLSGKSTPSRDNLFNLSNSTGRPVEWFLGQEPPTDTLTAEERLLLDRWRRLAEKDKKILIDLLDRLPVVEAQATIDATKEKAAAGGKAG